ncbi:unnamed protein product [Peronospora destructor]|uniref:PIPK domain-containing protein n=1 Tax=Peronospora destructor TaxID=86335 RepID=A0AAV0V9L6_9STRA|nr:unnamed protein product [Peronospora destructor]
MESNTEYFDDTSDVAACTMSLQAPLGLDRSIDDTDNSIFSISPSPVPSPLHPMHQPPVHTIVDISSVESNSPLKSVLRKPNSPLKRHNITKRVSIEHIEIGSRPDQENRSISQHSVDSAVNRRVNRTRTDHSKTSTQSSFAVRDSILSRVSSNVSGLRESFFGVIGRGPPVNDPLELSPHQEFNLDVIDESGGMGKTIGEILKPQADFRNWSNEGYTILSIGFILLLLMFVAAELADSLDGYTIDPGLVFGSLVTLILCFCVFVTYHGVQSFQTHPNPLIYYKCIIDIFLALRFLLDPLLSDLGVYRANDEASCAYLSGITQFLYLSSDCWYFALIFDSYWSLTNPFMSVKANRRRCKILVYSTGVLTGTLAAFVPGIRGFADGNYCWTKRKTTNDPVQRDFFHLNKGSWLLFYSWMILFYISGIAVLTFGVKRLRSGLRDTLQSRCEDATQRRATRMTYDKNGHISPSRAFRAFTFTLTARGAVDYFVWFMINRPSLIRANWLNFTSDSADKQFSAQLNTTLQEELIYFTIEGMTRAVKIAEEDLVRIRDRSPTQELVLGASDSEDDRKSTRSLAEAATTATGPIRPKSSSNFFCSGPRNRMLYTIQEVINAGLCRNSSAEAETRAIKKKNSKEGDFSFDIPADQRSVQQPSNANRRASNPSSASTTATSVGPRSQFPVADMTAASVRFTPYKPQAFAELREAYGIKAVDFMKSFETSTKPKISEGASGAFMFFSGDKKYIVKSMAEEEARFLCEIAEKYAEYLTLNSSSLITKFYGCFKITMYDKRFYFVVMENLFDVMEEGVHIHHRFDIKGSWVNRSYKRPRLGAKVKCRHCSMMFKYGAKKGLLQCPNVVGLHEPNVVLKDNDLRTRMRIGTEEGIELFEQLCDDSLFLCDHGIMDYSLLLGVMDIEFAVDQPVRPPTNSTFNEYTTANPAKANLSTTDLTKDSFISMNRSLESSASELSAHYDDDDSMANASNTLSIAPSVHSLFQQSNNSFNQSRYPSSGGEPQPKRAMRKSQRIFGPGYYYVGIIDILQTWTLQKQLERFWKVQINQKDGDGLSALDPVRYQRRFEAKLREIIAIPKEFYQCSSCTRGPTKCSSCSRQFDCDEYFDLLSNTVDDGDLEQAGRNPQPILLAFNQRLLTKTTSTCSSHLNLTDSAV